MLNVVKEKSLLLEMSLLSESKLWVTKTVLTSVCENTLEAE